MGRPPAAKYRPPHLPRNRGQSWPTFVRNHLHQTWTCDCLTIVTLRFQILYCFVILDLVRREIVHIGVTSSPSAQYAGQCFVEAVADRDNENPRFLIRDRDSIHGAEFRRRVKIRGRRCLITPTMPTPNVFSASTLATIMADPIAVFTCSHHLARVGFLPCGVFHPRTLSLDLSSAGSITSTTRGSPETDRRGTWWTARGRESCVRSLLSGSRPRDPRESWLQDGAAQPSLPPILVAVW